MPKLSLILIAVGLAGVTACNKPKSHRSQPTEAATAQQTINPTTACDYPTNQGTVVALNNKALPSQSNASRLGTPVCVPPKGQQIPVQYPGQNGSKVPAQFPGQNGGKVPSQNGPIT